MPLLNTQMMQDAGLKLTDADAVGILGATYFALRNQVCESLADMQANNAAQGTILRLREELYTKTYGRQR